MKKTYLILLFVSISFFAGAQTQYYTTDGKNRLTEASAEAMLGRYAKKMGNVLGRKISSVMLVESNEMREDSIISRVVFSLHVGDNLSLVERIALENDSVGIKLPPFVLQTLAKQDFSSGQLLDKPTIIKFWNPHCKACLHELEELSAILTENPSDFNFIAITNAKRKKVKKFLKKHPSEFVHLIDTDKYLEKIAVSNFPSYLFLDRNGIIRFSKEPETPETDGNELVESNQNQDNLPFVIEQLKYPALK